MLINQACDYKKRLSYEYMYLHKLHFEEEKNSPKDVYKAHSLLTNYL